MEKDLGILVDEKLDTSQQCVLAGQKDRHILACLMKSVAYSGAAHTRNIRICWSRSRAEHKNGERSTSLMRKCLES